MATEKNLQEQVRAAFAATGPAALEVLMTSMADRITTIEGLLLSVTVASGESGPAEIPAA